MSYRCSTSPIWRGDNEMRGDGGGWVRRMRGRNRGKRWEGEGDGYNPLHSHHPWVVHQSKQCYEPLWRTMISLTMNLHNASWSGFHENGTKGCKGGGAVNSWESRGEGRRRIGGSWKAMAVEAYPPTTARVVGSFKGVCSIKGCEKEASNNKSRIWL